MDASDWQHFLFALVALAVLVTAGTILTLAGQTSNQKLLPSDHKPTNGIKSQRSLSKYLNARRSMAGAMRFIELLAAVIAASQLMALLDSWTSNDFSWLSIVMIAVVYIVFGRAVPRAVTSRNIPEERLLRLFSIGRIGVTITSPIAWLQESISTLIQKVLPGEPVVEEAVGTEDELQLRLMETDDGVIGDIERHMIDGILSLEEMTVRDIMVPRLDVVALDRRATAQEVIDMIIQRGHSRLPVYQENLDRILGVLYVKDLLPFVIGSTNRLPLLDLIRPAYVIPESKKLPELFADLKRMRIHLAIVTDEYGGTAGLVTIEDILEEIVGEFTTDLMPSQDVHPQDDGTFVIDGSAVLRDVNRQLQWKLPADGPKTLNGLITEQLESIPETSVCLAVGPYRIEILQTKDNMVKSARVWNRTLDQVMAARPPRSG